MTIDLLILLDLFILFEHVALDFRDCRGLFLQESDFVSMSRLRPCRWPLCCWLVGFLLFGFVFLNVSACAGSLVLDVSFRAPFKTTMISEADAIIFGARSYYSARVVPPFLYLGDDSGSLGAVGGQGSSRRDTLGYGVGF